MIRMYYLSEFARPKGAKDKQKRKQKIINNSLIGTGVSLYTGVPQRALWNISAIPVLTGKKLSEQDISDLSQKYKVPITISDRNSLIKGKIHLNPKTATRSTFLHELGHLKDKGLVNRGKFKPRSLGFTLATLRNEGVANINAIKMGGIKQIPNAVGSYGTYIAGSLNRHKRSLGSLALGTGITKTLLDRKKKNKNRYD